MQQFDSVIVRQKSDVMF